MAKAKSIIENSSMTRQDGYIQQIVEKVVNGEESGAEALRLEDFLDFSMEKIPHNHAAIYISHILKERGAVS